MENVKDRLGDLSWLGIYDQAWIEIEVPDPSIDFKKFVDDQIERDLKETAQMVAVDNLNMTKEQRALWIEYRKLLSEIPLQPDYPKDVYWPARPE